MNQFNDYLKGVDQKSLEKGMEKASAFAKTAQGKALIEKLKNASINDTDTLMQLIQQNPDLMKSAESFFKK